MTAARFSLALAVLAVAGLLAGCGSSSSSSSSTSSSTSTTASTSTTSTATAATTSTTTSTPAASVPGANGNVGVAEAVAVCKSIAEREPTLSASVKSKVQAICAKASHGNLAGARAAAKEVCKEVINAAPIPSQAKTEALAACEHSG
jgi:hypothetical protein